MTKLNNFIPGLFVQNADLFTQNANKFVQNSFFDLPKGFYLSSWGIIGIFHLMLTVYSQTTELIPVICRVRPKENGKILFSNKLN